MKRFQPTLPWLAWRHLWSRPQYAGMSILLMSLALVVAGLLMQLGRHLPRELERELKGSDLLVGPRGDPGRQVLAGLFLGGVSGSLPYETLPLLRSLPQVQLAVPVLMGERYRGHAIVGTEPAFMVQREARLAQGRSFTHVMEVVLGAQAAQGLGLHVGEEFSVPGARRPFVVVGILARQGTSLDGLILTDLSSIWSPQQNVAALTAAPSEDLGGVGALAAALPGPPPNQPGMLPGEESLGDISYVQVTPVSPEALAVLLPWLQVQPGLTAAVPREELDRMATSLAWLPTLVYTLLGLLLLCAWLAASALMLQAQEGRQQDLVLLRVLGAPAWRVALMPLLEWLWVVGLALILAGTVSELAWLQLRRWVPPEQLHWLGTPIQALGFAAQLAWIGAALALAGAAWPAWCAWRLQGSRMLQPGE